jgi:hypothetical protein
MRKQQIAIFVFLFLGLFINLFSASTGRITGSIYDASTRFPLVGANIVVFNTELGAAADQNGRFIVHNLPAGTYSVEASMIGYRSQVMTRVVVEPSKATELVFKLSQSAIEMAEITVRPDYFPKVKDASVSERNFNTEEIQTQPGGLGDIQRVVQAMPAVVSSGDQDNEIIVRGGNPNENLFLVDGIEIPYPNHFALFTQQGGPISMLNALLIREVDFVAGAFPARYGERASSVMDIALKNGSYTELAGNIDVGMAGLGIIFEGPLPNRIGSFLGSYHKSFLEIMAETKVWGEMTAVPYYDSYLGKLNFKLSPTNELSLLTLYGDDDIEIDTGQDVTGGKTRTNSKTSRLAAGIGWQTLFGEMGFGKLTLSWVRTHWDALNEDLYHEPRIDTGILVLSTEQALEGHYDASLRWTKKQETQLGIGFSRVPFSYQVYSSPQPLFNYIYDPVDSTIIDSTPYLDPQTGDTVITQFVDAKYEAASYKLGGYLQHKISLGDFINLSFGARADYFKYTDKFYISPRVGLTTKPFMFGFSFNLGYGWHRQPPAYYILLWDSVANHYLESQRSDHYIIGLERLFADDVKLSIEGYYKDVHNIAIPQAWTTPDPYDWTSAYVDVGKGQTKGIEFFLQKKFARNWNGTISYSFSDAKIANPQDASKTIPGDYDYRNVFSASWVYKIEFHKQDWYNNLPDWFKGTIGSLIFSDEADIGLRFRFMGGRPYTPKEWIAQTRRWVDNGDLLNSERYPDYHRLDLRWDHKFLFKKWSMSWYLEIQNLYARDNIWFYNYTHDAKIDTVKQFGFWPMAGMVIEF